MDWVCENHLRKLANVTKECELVRNMKVVRMTRKIYHRLVGG